MADFTVRGYEQGDEQAILGMFNEVFGASRDMAHWHWKYRDNPYGSFRISIAVSPEGVFASHYAGYPLRLVLYRTEGSFDEHTILQLGDKMTRRSFRSIGFGRSALLTRTFGHFKKTYGRDVLFGYGIGTHHSLRFGVLVLGYGDIEPVPYRILPAQEMRRKSGRQFPLFSRMKVEEVTAADGSWTDLFQRVARHYGCLVMRDETYVNWRYAGRPDRRYLILALKRWKKILGWSVFFRDDKRLFWVDAFVDPAAARYARVLLIAAVNHPSMQGVETVECWFPRRPAWWDSLLSDLGFRLETEPWGLHLLLPVYHDRDVFSLLRERFYYTMGDSDLF